MLHDLIRVVTFSLTLLTAVPLAHVMRCSIASNDKYKVGYLWHEVVLTEATGGAECVIWDGREFGHAGLRSCDTPF